MNIEGRRANKVTIKKFTLVAPLCHLDSRWSPQKQVATSLTFSAILIYNHDIELLILFRIESYQIYRYYCTRK